MPNKHAAFISELTARIDRLKKQGSRAARVAELESERRFWKEHDQWLDRRDRAATRQETPRNIKIKGYYCL